MTICDPRNADILGIAPRAQQQYSQSTHDDLDIGISISPKRHDMEPIVAWSRSSVTISRPDGSGTAARLCNRKACRSSCEWLCARRITMRLPVKGSAHPKLDEVSSE